MMRSATVFGSSGFVGSVCVAALRDAGWDVRAEPAPRLRTAARSTSDVGIALAHEESEITRLAALLGSTDVVVNAAGLPTMTGDESDELFGANALLPGVLCAAARRAGVRRYVHLSSVSVQGRMDPLDETMRHRVTSPYAASRALGESIVDGHGDGSAVILRLPSVLGSATAGQRVLQRLARSRLASTAGRVDRPRPMAMAENVGAAVAFLASHQGVMPRIVLQPGDGLTTGRVLEMLGGRRPARIPVPVARAVTTSLMAVGRRVPAAYNVGRGLELMWLGQRQVGSWLTRAGFVPPADAGAPARPLKVGVLTQWYQPELGPNPAPTATQFARRGHDVRVLTGFPNYPTGRIYPGHRQRWSHREMDGSIDLRRVPLYPSHDTSGVRRALTLLSFAASTTLARRFLADRDVNYVYASPITAAAAAAVLQRLRGVPYVLHVIDLWPESVLESGMAGGVRTRALLERVLGAAARHLYRHAEHVVAVTPGIQQRLLDRGVPAAKVSVVYNWSQLEGTGVGRSAPDPEVRARLGRPDRTLAVFAGNVGQMQDVETIVRAAALCQDDTPLDLAIVGAGTAYDAARTLASELGLKNVRFFGRVDIADMPPIYAASDYQLVTLKDRPVFHVTVPSKLGDALYAGCPIITNVPGDTTRMCREGGFGLACAPESPQALAEAFRLACAEDAAAHSRRCRLAQEFYRNTLSMQAAMDGLDAVLTGARHRRAQ